MVKWSNTLFVVVVAVVVVGMGSAVASPGPSSEAHVEVHGSLGQSSDTFPGTCDEAPVVEQGAVQGEINTPNDIDVFRINVSEGDYVAVAGTVPSDAEATEIHHSEAGVQATISTVNPEGIIKIDRRVMMYPYATVTGGTDVPTSYKVFAEESGHLCIGVYELKSEANIPYQWTLRFAKNEEPAWWTDAQELSPDEVPSRHTPSLDPPSLESTETERSPTPTETQRETPTETSPSSETDGARETRTAPQDNSDDGFGPGFGVEIVLAAFGGLGYVSKRRSFDNR